MKQFDRAKKILDMDNTDIGNMTQFRSELIALASKYFCAVSFSLDARRLGKKQTELTIKMVTENKQK